MVKNVRSQLLFHSGPKRGALLGVGSINKIHAGFVKRHRIKGSQDANVRHLRLGRMPVAVAVDGDVVHDADVNGAVAHEIDHSAGGLGHGFDEIFLGGLSYLFPHLVKVIGAAGGMDPGFSPAGAAADGEVLQRAAESAHLVALEVIKDDEAVVIGQRGSHKVAFKMRGAFGRRYFRFLKFIHNDDLGDCVEAVVLYGLPVVGSFHTFSRIGGVALHDVAF